MTASLADLSPKPLTDDDITSLTWSNSQLTTMRECEQKFDYSYVRKLATTSGRHPLDRGTWFHFIMAVQGLARGLQDGTLIHIPDRIEVRLPRLEAVGIIPGEHEEVDHPFAEGLKTLKVDCRPDECGWMLTVDREGADGPTSVEYPLSVKGALALLTSEVWDYMPVEEHDEHTNGDLTMPDEVEDLVRRYLYEHKDTIKSERVLAVEYRWEREHEGHMFTGAVDRLVVDERDLVIVRDHKTAAKQPSAVYRLTNSQLHFYAWGISRDLEEMGMSVDAVEFDYAITRRPGSVRLTNAGNLYSNVGKLDYVSLLLGLRDAAKERNAEIDAAEQAIAEAEDEIADDPNDEMGDERSTELQNIIKDAKKVLKKVRIDINDEKWTKKLDELKEEGSDFFHRVLMPVNDTVTENLLTEANATVSMAKVLLKQQAPPLHNFHWFNCDRCAFKDLCTAELYGQDASQILDDFVVRESAWHLTDNTNEDD